MPEVEVRDGDQRETISEGRMTRRSRAVNPDDAMCEAFRQRFTGRWHSHHSGPFRGLEPHACFVNVANAFG